MSPEEKIAQNVWETNLDEVIGFIKSASRKGDHDWMWIRNTECKYVSLRFDMRDGAFVISDRNGNRITFDELKYQR